MSVPYRLFYRLGFKPWEDAEEQPEFVEKISALFEHEEGGQEPPYGPALDVGCGSGIWGIQLAKRGWRVTGVDYSEKALDRARDQVSREGVDMKLVHGDVTDLRGAGVGSGFQLVLDTGTFHGLGDAERAAMAREVDAVAAEDATVLLIAWNRRRRGPFPRGVSQSEIEADFEGWSVTEEGDTGYPPPKPLRADERWYRLRRS